MLYTTFDNGNLVRKVETSFFLYSASPTDIMQAISQAFRLEEIPTQDHKFASKQIVLSEFLVAWRADQTYPDTTDPVLG